MTRGETNLKGADRVLFELEKRLAELVAEEVGGESTEPSPAAAKWLRQAVANHMRTHLSSWSGS